MSTARLANALWRAAARREARAFRHATRTVAAVQLERLRALLARNADTEVGRRHGFAAIRTWDDYRARVPLVGYDDLAGDIDRIARGVPGVLTAEPVRLFEPTSGTARGSKLVPVTASLRAEMRRGLDVWIDDLFTRLPDLARGPAYWSVTPLAPTPAGASGPPRTPGGVPVGFEDDTGYLGGLVGRAMRSALAVPTDVKRIADADAFRYATLRALVARADLRLVSVWNPTFFALLLDALPAHLDRLARDLAAGTLTPPAPAAPTVHGAVYDALRRGLRPDPRRAAAVRAAGADPARLWPRLGLVSAWADAAAADPARALSFRLPHAAFQAKGLLATEALVTVPLGPLSFGAPPGGPAAGAVLAVRSHAFEFLPDRDGATDTRLAHELSVGDVVRVVVTTGGGLYRYRLGDRVRVVGAEGEAPRLTFLGRAGATVDLVGEKLDETHVAGALARVVGAAARTAFVAPLPGESPAYALFADAPGADDATLRAWARALDAALRANVHVDGARTAGQLGPLRAFRIEEDGAAAFLRACVARGQRLGDVKPAHLHRATDWPERLHGRFV